MATLMKLIAMVQKPDGKIDPVAVAMVIALVLAMTLFVVELKR